MLFTRHYEPYITKHPTIESHLAMWKVLSVAVFTKKRKRKRREREELSAYAERL